MGGTLSGTSKAEELSGSFLTMSKSNANDLYAQYMQQINNLQEREKRDSNLLSPIPETDSNKFNTLDSHG